MADSLVAPAPVAAGQAAPGAPAHAPRPVLLISGARLAVQAGPGGRPVTLLVPPSPAPAGRTAILTMGRPGHVSEVPADALPFMGRGLDPGLFSVAALQRAEHGGRLPVRVSYRGRVPSLPGVTITHAAAGEAEGYLTARSALRFGAALHRQYLADHDRAAYGTDGLFGHGVSVALAGAAVPAPDRPRFVMRTLTLHGTSLAGRPDNGDVALLVSADDIRRVAGSSVFRHGIARVSVPVGRYWAIGLFLTGRKSAFVFARQFTVVAHGPQPRVQLAGQTATSDFRVSTPRPALMDVASFTAVLRGRTGPPTAVSLTLFGDPADDLGLALAPADLAPEAGHLQTFTQAQLVSPPGARPRYQYNLDFPGPPDRIPAQEHTVQPSSLATVTENLFQDQPSAGQWVMFGGTEPEFGAGVFAIPEAQGLPGQLVQYVTADPSVVWFSQDVAFTSSFAGGQAGGLRSYRPGEAATEDWGRYPLHPATSVSPAAGPAARIQGLQIPSAGRAGDVLTMAVGPFSDSTPGHFGRLTDDPTSKLTERYEVDQDGTRLAAGDASQGLAQVRLSPGPSAVRFTLSARRTGPHYILSPASTTTWQWRSQRDPSATVPPPWACLTGRRTRPFLTGRCAVQPMMTLAYQVAGLTLAGTTPPGRQQIGLNIGHIQLAASPAITSAALAVSFDGGRTWQPAQVTPGSAAGQFIASFTAPAGAFVTLRTTAADAAGGSVTESITRAYRTAPATARTMAAVQQPAGPAGFIRPPCARPQAGRAQCFLVYRPQGRVNRAIAAGRAAGPKGLSAAAIRSAYRLRSQGSPDQTVAVSIAFHTPHLARFLAHYRRQFGLPPCTVASGCFRQVNQHGGTKPAPSGVRTGWDLEATLDVSMVSAACPRCHILVVEGNSPSTPDLAATERTAARLGAQVISNSYGTRENGFSLPFRRAYQPRGRTVVASSGDSGFTDAGFPADLPTVTSVGGTRLARAHGRRGWHERVWQQEDAAGGSGCSAWIAKPAWQHDAHCPGRTISDISAVATNIPVFNPAYGGWVTLAGTSASAPLIAGIIGLAGNGASLTNARIYRHARSFFDVTAGSNTPGNPPLVACGDDYMCVAKKGYDAPTGLGTPDGPGGL
jgi:hypothetical protein